MSDARVPKATGLQARAAVWMATRQFGPEAADMAAVYSQHPTLLRWFALYDRAVSKPRRVPERLRKLAELKAATVVGCEACIDIGSSLARAAGLSDGQVLALHDPEPSGLFDADELLIIAYARAMSLTPPEVTDAQVAALRARFGDAGLFELTYIIAWENGRARLNTALDIPPGGFSAGQACARAADSALAAR
ncbi:MAG TPA: carboxymuconolactone decarboxylase family protein [Baekduia sp.]